MTKTLFYLIQINLFHFLDLFLSFEFFFIILFLRLIDLLSIVFIFGYSWLV